MRRAAIIGIILLAVVLVGSALSNSTYALFSNDSYGANTNNFTTGMLSIEAKSKSDRMSLANALPITDADGIQTNPYVFTIKNTGTLNGKYTISLEEKENNTLDKNYIKYSIREEGKEWSTPALLSSGLIIKENVLIESKKDVTYELKIWLDENAPNEVQGKTYSAKLSHTGPTIFLLLLHISSVD